MGRRSKIAVRVKLGGHCPDCDLRDALTVTGRPKRSPITGRKLTSGCESCGGSGVHSRTYRFDEEVLKRLTLKQRFVLERRLGLTDGNVYTQEKIAAALGVTRQAAAKLEANGRQKLLSLAEGCKKRLRSPNK